MHWDRITYLRIPSDSRCTTLTELQNRDDFMESRHISSLKERPVHRQTDELIRRRVDFKARCGSSDDYLRTFQAHVCIRKIKQCIHTSSFPFQT